MLQEYPEQMIEVLRRQKFKAVNAVGYLAGKHAIALVNRALKVRKILAQTDPDSLKLTESNIASGTLDEAASIVDGLPVSKATLRQLRDLLADHYVTHARFKIQNGELATSNDYDSFGKNFVDNLGGAVRKHVLGSLEDVKLLRLINVAEGGQPVWAISQVPFVTQEAKSQQRMRRALDLSLFQRAVADARDGSNIQDVLATLRDHGSDRAMQARMVASVQLGHSTGWRNVDESAELPPTLVDGRVDLDDIPFHEPRRIIERSNRDADSRRLKALLSQGDFEQQSRLGSYDEELILAIDKATRPGRGTDPKTVGLKVAAIYFIDHTGQVPDDVGKLVEAVMSAAKTYAQTLDDLGPGF